MPSKNPGAVSLRTGGKVENRASSSYDGALWDLSQLQGGGASHRTSVAAPSAENEPDTFELPVSDESTRRGSPAAIFKLFYGARSAPTRAGEARGLKDP